MSIVLARLLSILLPSFRMSPVIGPSNFFLVSCSQMSGAFNHTSLRHRGGID